MAGIPEWSGDAKLASKEGFVFLGDFD